MVPQASDKGSERPHLVSGQEERRARLLHPAAAEVAGLAGRAAGVYAEAPRQGRPGAGGEAGPDFANRANETFCETRGTRAPPVPGQKGLGPLLGARVRHSARGKGQEEGGSTYAKAGSSLRSPPGNPRASTPITRACLLYYFVLIYTSDFMGGCPPPPLSEKELT